VPQLILPMARDQAAKPPRGRAEGAGLRLPPSASHAEIAAAINRLVTEPQFQGGGPVVSARHQGRYRSSSLSAEMETIAA